MMGGYLQRELAFLFLLPLAFALPSVSSADSGKPTAAKPLVKPSAGSSAVRQTGPGAAQGTVGFFTSLSSAGGAGAATARGGVPGSCCDTTVTQNLDNTTVIAASTVACLQGGTITVENAWARCFGGSTFPTDFTLKCVDFGVQQNTGCAGDFDVDLRIVRLVPTASFPALACPLPLGLTFGDPNLGQTWFDVPPEFQVLHLQTVTVPSGFSGILQVTLSSLVTIPAGAEIVVEVHAASRAAADGGDGGAFFVGSNEANPPGDPPTYIWAAQCGVIDYQNLETVVSGNPFTADFVLRLDGTFTGASNDCNAIPDVCEPDCNANGLSDACDIAGGASLDCDTNGVPDECQPPTDCNNNLTADFCDIAAGTSQDCDGNGVPDECQPLTDCNNNLTPDFCDIAAGTSQDCNANGIPDECDITAGTSQDCNVNSIPDECEIGCTSQDCNGNGIPDECDPPGSDCNANGISDECDIISGFSQDCNGNGIPDECDIASSLINTSDATLVGYWSFDEGSGAVAGDSSGNGLNGTLNGSVSWVPGILGTALQFDPSLDFVEIANNPLLNFTTSFSVSFWINAPSAQPGTGGQQLATIIDKSHGAVDITGWAVQARTADAGAITMAVGTGSAFPEPQIPGVLDNTWHHVAITVTTSPTLTIKGYNNGALVTNFTDPATTIVPNDRSLFFGRFWKTPERQFEGLLDEVRIYNGVLDTCAISSLANPAGITDLNADGIPDQCELAVNDCNANGIPDECDITSGFSQDCNSNGVPDECDITAGTSQDVIGAGGLADGIPDECQLDCNGNLIPDDLDITAGDSLDCNVNGIPDECEIAAGTSQDCNANGIPDECELDTDGDGLIDDCDPDDDNDGVLDGADPARFDPSMCGDVDADGCDDCSVGTDGFGPLSDSDPANDGPDFDADGICDFGDPDIDGDGVPNGTDTNPFDQFLCGDLDVDTCEDCSSGASDPLNDGPDFDGDGLCNAGDLDDDNDGVDDMQDAAPLNPNICRDIDADGCDDCTITGADQSGGDPLNDGPDTDLDGICDLSDNCVSLPNPGQEDCQANGIGDVCDIANLTSSDCNGNGIPDECDIVAGFSQDCTGNGIPDECEPDCNANSVADSCDILAMTSTDCNGNGIPDECDIDVNSTAPGGPFFCTMNCDPDCNNNGIPDACDIANCAGDPACGDCNANGVLDGCDIAGMTATDVINNTTGLPGSDGVPDSCSRFNAPGVASLQGTGDSWNIAANWLPPGVPNNEPVGGRDFSASILQPTDVVLLDIDSTINTMTLGPSATLNITSPNAAGNLTIASANGILNNGNVFIGSGRSLIAGTSFLLRGGGQVRLADPTASLSSLTSIQIIASTSNISGVGVIEAALVNDVGGLVSAGNVGAALTVQGPNTKTNDGIFEATGGGILQVADVDVAGTGAYRADGGTIRLLPAGGTTSIAGSTLDITNAGIVEMNGAAAIDLSAGTMTIDNGGIYLGTAGASGTLSVGSLGVNGAGNGGQMLLSNQMRANIVAAISIDGTSFPCGPLRGCTPPILSLTGGASAQAASMDVLAGVVELSGGSMLDVTGPVVIDRGGSIQSSGQTTAIMTAGSLSVVSSGVGGQLDLGGSMNVSVVGSFSVTGCGGVLLLGCTPPILRVHDTPMISVGGDITIDGSVQVNVIGGPTINLAGDFDNHSIAPSSFDWTAGALTLDGVNQTFELAGENRGVSAASFVDNFAMGTLRVEAGTTVDFVDGFENIPGAGCEVLYVDTLSLGMGATIRLNGCFIFYRNLVDEGATIDPTAGGALVCFNPGDVNCDGLIDMNDADAMLSAMLDPSANPQGAAAADLNGDGSTDGNDIQTFVDLIVGP